MSEQQPKFLTALASLFPVLLLLVIDIFALWLQPQSKAISHLALGVLTAQLICLIVFLKGEICNGQRSRLSLVNMYFAIFWVVWFLLSFLVKLSLYSDRLCKRLWFSISSHHVETTAGRGIT